MSHGFFPGLRSRPSGGNNASGPQAWLNRPAAPHDDDDEFESTTLTGWTATPSAAEGSIDPYSTNSAAGPLIELHTQRRRSWLMVQPKSATNNYIAKSFTVPTNCWIWCRFSYNHDLAIGASEAILSLMLSADIDNINNDSVYVQTVQGTSTDFVRFDKVESTSQTQIGSTTDVDSQGQALELMGLQKIGTTVHGWAGTAAGSWIYLNSTTYGGATLDNLGLRFFDNAQFSPGTPVFGVDFVRIEEIADGPP